MHIVYSMTNTMIDKKDDAQHDYITVWNDIKFQFYKYNIQ